MNRKLTLRVDEELIKVAKEYSARTGKSVSKLVADFFAIIKNEKEKPKKPTSPAVASLRGVLKKSGALEKDYKDHLDEKYS